MPSPPEEREPPGSGGPGQPPPPPPTSAEEALRRLEQRLDRATEAAERLMAEAATEAAGASNPSDPTDGIKPPPAGWQIPDDAHNGTSPELEPFVTLLQAVRELIPPELQRRLVTALRELLLALRALIDWYLERLERRRERSVEVEDIPIL
ncbi:MAG: hypothetical protein JO243_05310 [Solirubrobacterales bacterium]|nr:hypothetical protein [Solirubrobacterales bacterium]